MRISPFCVFKCAPKRQVREHRDANGPVCVLKCARSSFQRALKDVLGRQPYDVPGLIEALHLPQYTYPVLGLAIGKPDQAPALKPRMPRELQFFDDVYPSDDDATESIKERIGAFDVSVHEYYDLRNTDRPVDAFSDQIASIAAQRMDATHQVIPNATSQGFRLDR